MKKKQLKKTEDMAAEIETFQAELDKLSERTITLAQKNSKQKAKEKLKLIQTKQANITAKKKLFKEQLKRLSDDLRQLYNERERIIKIPVGLSLYTQIKF